MFLLLGLATRIARWACQFPLWGDEAFVTLNFLDRDYAGLLSPLRHYQIAPLGFLFTEKFCLETLGTGELALRALPCFLGSISLLIFARFTSALLSWKTALLALAILAVSHYPIRHACEIKPYASDLFASCILLWIFSLSQQRPSSAAPWYLLILLAPALLFLSFPAIFVALGIWCAMVFPMPRPWKARALFLPALALLVIACAFLTHFQLIAKQQFHHEQARHTAYWDSTFPPANPIQFIPWWIDTHAGNMSAYPLGGKHGASSIQFLLTLSGLMFLARRKSWPLLIALASPFVFNLFAAALGRYPYGGSARVAQHLAPALCILIALGLAQVFHYLRKYHWHRRLANAFLPALFLLGILSILRDFLQPYKSPEDLIMKNMAIEVTRESSPNRPLIITRPREQLDPGIEWYLRTLSGKVIWKTEGELAAFTREQGRAQWLWLPARDPGGNLLPEFAPTTLESCDIQILKSYLFPLGRIRQTALQAQWLELSPTKP